MLLRRVLRRSVGAAVSLAFMAVFMGASVVPQPARPPQPAAWPAPQAQPAQSAALRVVQLNLCGSGWVGCYTGRSVAAAAAVIRAHAPDVVTLNEVCRDHVDALAQTVADVFGTGSVVSGFTAVTTGTGRAVRCRTGQPFGIGVIAHVPAAGPAPVTDSGIYPVQDQGETERRAWLCLHVPTGFVACTTHLTNASAAVALAQCRYLLRAAVPSVRTRVRTASGGAARLVVAGDLNLRDGGLPDLRSCLPSGYLHAGDGHVQHVVTTASVAVDATQPIDMAGTTDHPALLVTVRRLR